MSGRQNQLAHIELYKTTPNYPVGGKGVKGCPQQCMSNHLPVGSEFCQFGQKAEL